MPLRLLALTGLLPAASRHHAHGDRACLEAYVDRYLDAVIKHDPKGLPFTRNVKFTEMDRNSIRAAACGIA